MGQYPGAFLDVQGFNQPASNLSIGRGGAFHLAES